MRTDLVELVERQNAIISIQAGVIDELFWLLMQHVTVEEADGLPLIGRINEAAGLRQETERRYADEFQ